MHMEQKPEERGQSLVEYALILVLAVIVVILVLGLVGDSIVNLWNDSVVPLLDVFAGAASDVVEAAP
jgi:Flp pilus assembly pilin Flp